MSTSKRATFFSKGFSIGLSPWLFLWAGLSASLCAFSEEAQEEKKPSEPSVVAEPKWGRLGIGFQKLNQIFEKPSVQVFEILDATAGKRPIGKRRVLIEKINSAEFFTDVFRVLNETRIDNLQDFQSVEVQNETIFDSETLGLLGFRFVERHTSLRSGEDSFIHTARSQMPLSDRPDPRDGVFTLSLSASPGQQITQQNLRYQDLPQRTLEFRFDDYLLPNFFPRYSLWMREAPFLGHLNDVTYKVFEFDRGLVTPGRLSFSGSNALQGKAFKNIFQLIESDRVYLQKYDAKGNLLSREQVGSGLIFQAIPVTDLDFNQSILPSFLKTSLASQISIPINSALGNSRIYRSFLLRVTGDESDPKKASEAADAFMARLKARPGMSVMKAMPNTFQYERPVEDQRSYHAPNKFEKLIGAQVQALLGLFRPRELQHLGETGWSLSRIHSREWIEDVLNRIESDIERSVRPESRARLEALLRVMAKAPIQDWAFQLFGLRDLSLAEARVLVFQFLAHETGLFAEPVLGLAYAGDWDQTWVFHAWSRVWVESRWLEVDPAQLEIVPAGDVRYWEMTVSEDFRKLIESGSQSGIIIREAFEFLRKSWPSQPKVFFELDASSRIIEPRLNGVRRK